MNETTILPVKDNATDEALMLCALDQKNMGKKLFILGDGGQALDALSGRLMH